MRNVFFALLLANILMFLWYGGDPLRTDRAVGQAHPVAPALLTSTQAPTTGDALPHDATKSCYRFGPFTDQPQARALADRLRGYGWQVVVHTQETKIKIGEWIHLPAADNREAAKAEAERLRQLGVSDLYVMSSDEQQNVISLGLYGTEKSAQQRLSELRDVGITAVSEPKFRESLAYSVIGSASPEEPDLATQESGQLVTCSEVAPMLQENL